MTPAEARAARAAALSVSTRKAEGTEPRNRDGHGYRFKKAKRRSEAAWYAEPETEESETAE